MKKERIDLLRYLSINNENERWGIVCTTVGYQTVSPNGTYPVSKHPDNYCFKKQSDRVLNEYQLVYIIEGSGYFSSKSCKKTRITPGTMIQLFPGEEHLYYPDKETGWSEYWVGFKGEDIDKRVQNGFFTPQEPIHKIGVSETIISLYDNIIKYLEVEKSCYQPLISSIVLHILGVVYYKIANLAYSDNDIADKINLARTMIRNSLGTPLAPEKIAQELGLSYSWFRRIFKQYTGTSPGQYQMQLRLVWAKELLSGSRLTVSEIAYKIGFESVSQFSTFFKNKEGITTSEFRNRIH